MSELDFDARLGGQLRAFAEGGVRPIDRYAIAAATVAAGSRRGLASRLGRPRWGTAPAARRWALILVMALSTVALLGAALLLGGGLVPAPLPSPTPSSPSPSSTPPPVQLHGTYTAVSDMAVARDAPIMVTLSDGRVLVSAGGVGTSPAEVFDPATGHFTSLTGGWGGIGSGVLLQDGRALVQAFDSNALGSRLALFDPRTMSITEIGPAHPYGITSPSLALLADGRVLIAGGGAIPSTNGNYARTPVATAEIFDPATNTLSPTGSMTVARSGHTATTLLDGRVLIAGGDVGGDFEIYDPVSGRFTLLAGPRMIGGSMRSLLLPDGRVFLFDVRGQPQIYDPARNAFAAAPSFARDPSAAFVLGDGRIFMTGSSAVISPWVTIYDPTTGATATLDGPPVGWQEPALLHDGRVLFVGGMGPSSEGHGQLPLPDAEILEWTP